MNTRRTYAWSNRRRRCFDQSSRSGYILSIKVVRYEQVSNRLTLLFSNFFAQCEDLIDIVWSQGFLNNNSSLILCLLVESRDRCKFYSLPLHSMDNPSRTGPLY